MLTEVGQKRLAKIAVRGGIMMTGQYSHNHGVTIHEGPMADKRGTGWRDDAAKLEKLNQERIESPMQTLPNSMTTIDKAHAHGAKSDEGTVDKTANAMGGDEVRA
jgi:hypothetical protein